LIDICLGPPFSKSKWLEIIDFHRFSIKISARFAPQKKFRLRRQSFGAGGAIIQKKNKEKEKGKGKEERREKRKKERGEFNLEDPMFLFNFHSFFQKIIK